jgi:DNA-binding MarR family transcriptional regulator
MPKRRSAASADRAKRAAARASRVKKSGSFAETYLSYLLARASHIVASGFHAKLKSWNLSVPEYRVVFCLAGADGLGVGDLAAMAIMTQPRMTKVLDRMERQGLVGRHSDDGDRRRVLIHLTAAGRKRAAPVLRAARGPPGAPARALHRRGAGRDQARTRPSDQRPGVSDFTAPPEIRSAGARARR